MKTPSLVDRMAHKYTDRLVGRVEAMYNQLKAPCNLLDLPPAPTRPPTTRKKVVHIKTVDGQNHQSATDPMGGDGVLVKPLNAAGSVYDSKQYQIKVI